ncbi:12050_t:CDS:2 [Funneliformis geosporum]|uniref:13076_t:CDS:1 n=1 Tax=Funneliformis geosporum TaxID=1117311 RepID=A0A9W4SIM1_9GLOM|nr:12050_t:CDS:2 [Funneliformis geosporum]CAI2169711.1 13076_t:CDS:2 [Funneliformis geosporum]
MGKSICRIILNVGGVKHETTRDTLLIFPDSLLGTMFKEENLQMCKLENGNEVFLDRNGHAFHYILEFYRTRKLLWSDHLHYITKEEIESEIDFFQLPIELPLPPPVVEKPDSRIEALNELIGVFESLISTAKGIYIHKLDLTFPCYDKDGFFMEPRIKRLVDIVQQFSDSAFHLLHKFGERIGSYLKENDNELKWELSINDLGWHNAKCIINIEIDAQYDESLIIDNSIIGRKIYLS